MKFSLGSLVFYALSTTSVLACSDANTGSPSASGGSFSAGGSAGSNASAGRAGAISNSGGMPSAGTAGSASGSAGTAASAGGASGGTSGTSAGGTAGGTSAGGTSAGGTSAGGTAGGTSAGGTSAGGTAGGTSAGGAGGGSPLPPVTDYTKAGPFATTVDMKVGPNGAYTVFRPSMLGQNGFVHSPIIFGPGIGQQVSVHTTMLTNFASHGFVVVGTPVLNGGPGDAGNLKSMRDGLDWIVQQATASGSIYQGKLDVKRAVSMGYSVGGTAAVQLGGHEAVATTVSIHGHTASAGLHGPMLQTTGTKDTVGLPLQQQTYSTSTVQTFLATLTGADHGYIQNQGGGNERPAILAWMRYFIYNDAGAKHYFYGTDCVLCMAPWENPQRKNWP